ncbi:MAG: dockerin type I repeat-containing protein, partial [Clostridia bacterium]|nr:dockerin type I repeat-containing protein [Clostridia bacterium]
SDYIPTGGVLETSVGNYTLIVRGDLNGDGSLKLNDLAMAQKIFLELSPKEEIKLKAADLNKNEEFDLNDLSKLQKIFLGM